jgi:peptide/nickel transport system substrate-binding protein
MPRPSSQQAPYQVTYTFSTPFGEWYSLFGILYPAAYNSSPSLFDTGYLNKIPVTAGPFELGGIDQSSPDVTQIGYTS